MPLNPAPLADAIAQVFSDKLNAPATIAQKLAKAYTDYASQGMFGTGAASPTPASTTAMQGAILAAIASPQAGTPVMWGLAWANGLTAFWPGLPVTGGQSGAAIACAGAAACAAPITAAVANIMSTEQLTAQLISVAVHAATLTTTALVTNLVPIPPTIVLPIL